MAPINFEKNIREKLQERELQPSSDAWDKLSAQLEIPEEKKTNGLFWLAIAASLVGVLVISGYFLTRAQVGLENQLVEESKQPELMEGVTKMSNDDHLNLNDEASSISIDISMEGELISSETASSVADTQDAVSEEKNISAQKPLKDQNLKIETGLKTRQDAVVAIQDSKTLKNREVQMNIERHVPPNNDMLINNKVSEIVASVQNMQAKNREVSMEEIEGLLAQAQRDIAMERILSANKIDPQALLMDVELDLERTFRDRVFYALGEGFDYVKSTVVNGHD